MKKTILLTLLAATALPLMAQDFVAPIPRQPDQPAPKIVPAPDAGGAIPTMMRTAEPLQMLNPRAPRAYGDGRQFVEYDHGDPFQSPYRRPRPMGIRLFSVNLNW